MCYITFLGAPHITSLFFAWFSFYISDSCVKWASHISDFILRICSLWWPKSSSNLHLFNLAQCYSLDCIAWWEPEPDFCWCWHSLTLGCHSCKFSHSQPYLRSYSLSSRPVLAQLGCLYSPLQQCFSMSLVCLHMPYVLFKFPLILFPVYSSLVSQWNVTLKSCSFIIPVSIQIQWNLVNLKLKWAKFFLNYEPV
jgi:hypothetical protein